MSSSFWTANHTINIYTVIIPTLISFIFSISITNGQSEFPSYIAVRCQNKTANESFQQIWGETISDTTAQSTIEKLGIQIPINYHSNFKSDSFPEMCYLYILLSDNGALAFDSESKCKLSIELREGDTQNPTIDPTFNPTHDPTMEPISVSPTIEPTTDPTCVECIDTTAAPTSAAPSISPTNDPTVDPTSSPTSDPTEEPTLDPTANPVSIPPTSPPTEPSSAPSKAPTQETEFIDLDEILMFNIFNVNNENLMWINGYNVGNNKSDASLQINPFYYFKIAPTCNNGTATSDDILGTQDITATDGSATLLYDKLISLYNGVISFTEEKYPTGDKNALQTALFPTKFTINTHDTASTSSADFSIMNDTKTPDITCNYNQPFETIADDDNTSATRGIEYIFFPKANINSSLYKQINEEELLTLDVIISRECTADTLSPTSAPTISTTTDDTFLLGLSLTVFIIVVSVGGFCLCAIIFIVICLIVTCSNKDDDEVWDEEDSTDDPKKKLEMAPKKTAKFMVTEEEHNEMLQKQHSLSITVGLDTRPANTGNPPLDPWEEADKEDFETN